METVKGTHLFNKDISTWFKGIAIIMIILSHYAEWWTWFYTEEGTSELIRNGISRFGPYGVAIFLLFSGYGLTKSAGNSRIGIKFILKRIVSVYIPYFILVLLIDLLSGGLEDMEDIIDLLYGNDFWYMTVLFSFYLAFMAIWLAFSNRHIRAVLMVIFTYWYSNYLYKAGEQDFWYISNIAFAIGVLLALYEPVIIKVVNKISFVATLIFAAGSVAVVRSALFVEHVWEQPVDEIRSRIIAVTIFTLFIVFLASRWNMYDNVLISFGKYSLYLYLSHTFLFMWTINHFKYEMSINFVIAAVVIIVVSIAMGALIELLLKPVTKKLNRA